MSVSIRRSRKNNRVLADERSRQVGTEHVQRLPFHRLPPSSPLLTPLAHTPSHGEERKNPRCLLVRDCMPQVTPCECFFRLSCVSAMVDASMWLASNTIKGTVQQRVGQQHRCSMVQPYRRVPSLLSIQPNQFPALQQCGTPQVPQEYNVTLSPILVHRSCSTWPARRPSQKATALSFADPRLRTNHCLRW